MSEVQNVGAVDYAQYQPSQYPNEQYADDYSTQPIAVYDERAAEVRSAAKSRLGATLFSLAVVGGLALWGGHSWGKKGAAKEIEKLSEAAKKYENAQNAMNKIEKLAKEGNNQYIGENHCGNKLLREIEESFKPFKKATEEAGEKAENAADDVVKAAENAVK